MADLRDQLQELSELRRRGSLSAKQFNSARTYLLSQTREDAPSPRLELQIELAALDNNWNSERESFKVGTRYGWRAPDKGEGGREGKFTVIAGSLFAGLSTAVAVDATSQGHNPVVWMPLILGIVTTSIGLFSSLSLTKVADDYERAETKYQRERDELNERVAALS